MSSFGKVFKLSIELDVHFVKWNNPFCNNDDTDDMVDTAVAKLLLNNHRFTICAKLHQ